MKKPYIEVKKSPNRVTNNAIQSIRAVAFLMVFFYHLSPNTFPSGFVGVSVFFVLSGYLLIPKLIMEIEEKKTPKFDLMFHFCIKRFKRLFPALIMFLIFCNLVFYLFCNRHYLSTFNKESLFAILFLSNLFDYKYLGNYFEQNSPILLHLWSLSVEIQTNILVALFLIFTLHARKNLNRLFVLYLILTTVTIFFSFNLFQFEDSKSFLFYNPLIYSIYFFAGGLVGAIKVQRKSHSESHNHILILMLLVSSTITFTRFDFIFVNTLTAILFIVILYSMHLVQNTFTKRIQTLFLHDNLSILSKRIELVLKSIGDKSYSLYLVHQPIIFLCNMYLVSDHENLAKILFRFFLTSFFTWLFGTILFSVSESHNFDSIQKKSQNLVIQMVILSLVILLAPIQKSISPIDLEAKLSMTQKEFSNCENYINTEICFFPKNQNSSLSIKNSLSDPSTTHIVNSNTESLAIVGDSFAQSITPFILEDFFGKVDIYTNSLGGCPFYFTPNLNSLNIQSTENYRYSINHAKKVLSSKCNRRNTEFSNLLIEKSIKNLLIINNLYTDNSTSEYIAYETFITLKNTKTSKPNGVKIIVLQNWSFFPREKVASSTTGQALIFSLIMKRQYYAYFYSKEQLDRRNNLEVFSNKNGIFLFDVNKLLCFELSCKYIENGKFIYSDQHHLSQYANFKIAVAFDNYISKLLNIPID